MIVRLAYAITLAVLVTGCGRGSALPSEQPLTRSPLRF